MQKYNAFFTKNKLFDETCQDFDEHTKSFDE